MTRTSSILLCFFLVTAPSRLFAGEIEVPTDYPTIQAAIDAGQAHDVIVILPGIYHERIRLKPHLNVRSKGSNDKGNIGLKRAESTILDGGGKDSHATLKNNNITGYRNAINDQRDR